MAQIILSSNASFVALSPNGSAGVTLISVSLATRDKLMVIMCLEKRKQNYRNALVKQLVLCVSNILTMVKNLL
jgi:hypothetical protein